MSKLVCLKGKWYLVNPTFWDLAAAKKLEIPKELLQSKLGWIGPLSSEDAARDLQNPINDEANRQQSAKQRESWFKNGGTLPELVLAGRMGSIVRQRFLMGAKSFPLSVGWDELCQLAIHKWPEGVDKPIIAQVRAGLVLNIIWERFRDRYKMSFKYRGESHPDWINFNRES